MKKVDAPLTKRDLMSALDKFINVLVSELQEVLATKDDIYDMKEDIILKLDRIENRMIKIQASMDAIQEIYMFWAEHNLSPDLKEKYLEKKKN